MNERLPDDLRVGLEMMEGQNATVQYEKLAPVAIAVLQALLAKEHMDSKTHAKEMVRIAIGYAEVLVDDLEKVCRRRGRL